MKLYSFQYQVRGVWNTFECETMNEVEAWSEFYAHVGYDPEEVEFWCEDEE